MISPEEKGVDITFASIGFYCLETSTASKFCCGYIGENNSAKCLPDTFTDGEKERIKARDQVIDNRRHWITPKRPDKVIDVFYVYFSHFEGNGQVGYLLTAEGEVWEWREFSNVLEILIIIFAAIIGGFLEFLHYLFHMIRFWVNKRLLPLASP
jgi:hypothetical protein